MKRRRSRGVLLALWLAGLLLADGPGEEAVPTGGGTMVQLPDTVPVVALTFDDGPRNTTTGPLLEGLALREVPATFFLVGQRIAGSEALIREMKAAGHQIGVHTYDHVLMTELTQGEFEWQVERTREELTAILGEDDYWLRPPYGIVNDSVLRWADGPLILWSVDPEDWKDSDTDRIVASVVNRVKDGDIILMHDIYDSSVEAALRIVDALLDRGYCFVTVEQLMALRGMEPERGGVYMSLPPKAGKQWNKL